MNPEPSQAINPLKDASIEGGAEAAVTAAPATATATQEKPSVGGESGTVALNGEQQQEDEANREGIEEERPRPPRTVHIHFVFECVWLKLVSIAIY